MAYSDPAVYTIFFKDKPVGQVTDAHYGIGWKRGRFRRLEQTKEFEAFFQDYEVVFDMMGDEHDKYLEGIEELKEKYGSELLDERNWFLLKEGTNEKSYFVFVPEIDLEINSMGWKPDHYREEE